MCINAATPSETSSEIIHHHVSVTYFLINSDTLVSIQVLPTPKRSLLPSSSQFGPAIFKVYQYTKGKPKSNMQVRPMAIPNKPSETTERREYF
jgi:hypothetical protein